MAPFSQFLTLSSAASYEYYSENVNYDFRNRIGRPFPPEGLEIALLDIFYTPAAPAEKSTLDTFFGGMIENVVRPSPKCILVECSAAKPQQQSDAEFRPIVKMMALPKIDTFNHINFSRPVYYPLSSTPSLLEFMRIRLLDEAFMPLQLKAQSATTVILHVKRPKSAQVYWECT